MRRVEFEWKPHTGQEVKRVDGPLAVGEQVEFVWRTTREDDPIYPFSASGAKQGAFTVDALPGNNATLTGEIKGVEAQGAAEGAIKSGSGQTSFHWDFKKECAVKADTEYSVIVTISVDQSVGINGKLDSGTRS